MTSQSLNQLQTRAQDMAVRLDAFAEARENNVIHYDDQSEEMRTFAEEHDAVWVEGEDGQRVAVPYAENVT